MSFVAREHLEFNFWTSTGVFPFSLVRAHMSAPIPSLLCSSSSAHRRNSQSSKKRKEILRDVTRSAFTGKHSDILLASCPKINPNYILWYTKESYKIVIKQILQKARQSDRRNSYPPFFSDHTLWKSMITWITRSRCPVEQSIDRVPQQMTRDIICYDSVSVITCRTA